MLEATEDAHAGQAATARRVEWGPVAARYAPGGLPRAQHATVASEAAVDKPASRQGRAELKKAGPRYDRANHEYFLIVAQTQF